MSVRGSGLDLTQVLALDFFPPHVLLGGAAGLGDVVATVVGATDVHQLENTPPGALVVFPREHLPLEEPQADIALRLARSSDAAGIVAEQPPGRLPMATVRLADKFRVPLIAVPELDPHRLTTDLDAFIRAPEMEAMRSLRNLIDRIGASHNDEAELLRGLRAALGGPVAVINAAGRVLGGEDNALRGADPGEIERVCSRDQPITRDVSAADGDTVHLQPALPPWRTAADLWLAARVPISSTMDTRVVRQVLTVASLAFGAQFSRTALAAERENRERALLLSKIIEESDSPRRDTIERAATLNWRLSGWHMAVQVSVAHHRNARLSPQVIPDVESALARQGIPTTMVEKPDGWVFWVTQEAEPHATETLDLTRRVRRALLEAGRGHPNVRLSAGVGRPHSGTAGIDLSLREARNGCLLARTSETPAAVEHVDAMNVRRLMTSWYNSEPVRETAEQFLAPLLEADPSGELVHTLRCYLDHESSATTSAVVLGIHRNTVIQRLTRIRALLPLDLSRPDERLVAHLATRGTGLGQDSGT
ncbi:helix-turn-helix domain-containing protein [Streptomyces sp. NPDC056296]|uniref:helix-turn-helix domain-containing protein n=1 Tax=Streptomyces sp. NPDC056296 TaxID=3345775 RepID=UPI0035D76396